MIGVGLKNGSHTRTKITPKLPPRPSISIITHLVEFLNIASGHILLDFSLTVKAAPYECVIRTSQP